MDERPEEVTHFRRALGEGTEVNADVIASSNDQPLADHVRLSELMLEHLRIELECGRDVVVLVDSLTRMVRAFNLAGGSDRRGRSHGGRTLSRRYRRERAGAAAPLLWPGAQRRKWRLNHHRGYGAGRDQFHGWMIWSLRNLRARATARLSSAARMAEARVYPAIDLRRSGTRKEAKLYSEEDARGLIALRRPLGR